MADRERVARNEALFRGLNEKIGAGRDRGDDRTQVGFVCECGHTDCHRIIELTAAEYEGVRAQSTHFAVLPEHVIPEAEYVVDKGDGWVVVEKVAEGREVAEAYDERSHG